MKQIHRQILRMFPGPFLGWLATFMFLLVMQFLIRHLPDLVGKGLPFLVIVEILIYNLAYMVVLAVPMSVLIATLMIFGRLAETNVYTVLKSSGVSLPQIVWPLLIVGAFLSLGMSFFNSEALPAANFRASSLWRDIQIKKPGFELKPGVFYDGLTDYSILVQELPPETNELIDVTIYDYSDTQKQSVVIKSATGEIIPHPSGERIDLILYDGEIHRLIAPISRTTDERYEALKFGQHRLTLDLTEFSFERSDPESGYRSDRTMRSADMVLYVDSMMMNVDSDVLRLRERNLRVLQDSSFIAPPKLDLPTALPQPADTARAAFASRIALEGLAQRKQREIYEKAMANIRGTRTDVTNIQRTVHNTRQKANRYRVEIHKKFSIAIACLIFMLIGAPLGLSIRRGGMGAAGATAVGIFMFYWVSLVQGEKFADRGFLDPWVGMWAANGLMLVASALLITFIVLDLRARKWFSRNEDAEDLSNKS